MNRSASDASAQPDEALPMWARAQAFSSAPEGYGWIDHKGRSHPCLTLEHVEQAVRADRGGRIELVWTPQSAYCQLPDEVPELKAAMASIRRTWAIDDEADARIRLLRLCAALALLIAWMAWQGYANLKTLAATNALELDWQSAWQLIGRGLITSPALGFAVLFVLLLGFIPYYSAWRNKRDILALAPGEIHRDTLALLRFETWLATQQAPFTRLVAIVLAVVFGGQLLSQDVGIIAAGLVKSAYDNGQWWRLFTAPLMHGNILHFVLNAMALLYLGKRTEVFAGWPHLAFVFIFAALIGGEVSARFSSATSVGASGGLMGLLGFLLVFETMHSRLIPRSARRRLLGGLVLTVAMGVLGYRFIDHAAHVGGLCAGALYAAVVFRHSTTALRPHLTVLDWLLGTLSMASIMAAGLFTLWKIEPRMPWIDFFLR